MNAKRFWLALWYALAATVVPAFHDHRGADEDVVPTAIAGCDDPSPHLSGHGAADLSHPELNCPACQFRAEHQATIPAALCVVAPRTTFTNALLASLCESVPVARASSRAPPVG